MTRLVRKLSLMAVAVAAFAASAGSASAAIANATFGFAPLGGTVGYTGPNLANATSIDLGTGAFFQVNQIPATYQGNPNDFANPANGVMIGSQVTLSATTVSFPPAVINGPVGPLGLDITFGAGGRYTLTVLDGQFTTQPLNDNFLAFEGLGLFQDTLYDPILGTGFEPNLASFAFNLNQSGGVGAVNVSFTFGTPPFESSIPEPASLALAGVAVTGLGLRAVRRKKA